MDSIGWSQNLRPGYRLKKLEVTNWGTFDSTTGQVFSLVPDGRTALLVGQNGSGKSTLVDTLLTLLVQPGIRNYNVAAGAKKRERDERTYIRGACGRSSDSEAGTVTDYLRPDDKHYSVLLACFERSSDQDAFTIIQVLQIGGDGNVDKTYAFADCEKSIAEDLSGLTRKEKIRKQLVARGFKATTKYSEYYPWFARKTNMRTKAMDVFNQTVAVKDIQSLNRFIRDHMLEAKPWRDRIESLLSHFSQLSQAHQSLVKARRQIELLQPIQQASVKLQRLSTDEAMHQQQLDAIDSFFRTRTIDWLTPSLTGNEQAIRKAQTNKAELEKEIDALDDTQRYFKNEIEKTGGERLRQLPHQLETQQALYAAKKRERTRLNTAIKLAGLDYALNDAEDLKRLPIQLARVQEDLADQSTRIAAERLELARQLTDVRGKIEEETAQVEFLGQQSGHLPNWLAEVRAKLVAALEIDETELPFACELIAVAEDQEAWQSAIESVLRDFALTMLVPEKHFRKVCVYVESNPIVDRRGKGHKLEFVCVPSQVKLPGRSAEATHPDALPSKLSVRQNHSVSSWLEDELHKKFGFRGCETAEQFRMAPGLAMTPDRQVKFGESRQQRDSRTQSEDVKRYVLGWDNAQRLIDLRQSISQLQAEEATTLDAIHELEADSRQLSKRLAAIDTALGIDEFDSIDSAKHLQAIEKLEAEREAIENSNDAVRLLRERLDETIARRFAAQKERDAEVAAESNLLRESDQATSLIARHTAVLEERKSNSSFAAHELMFEQLADGLGEKLTSISDISEMAELQTEASMQLQNALNRLSKQAEPLRADVIRAMQRFLSDSPEERDDLRADLLYMDGFLGLLDQLQRDDLPKYEQRFQERLNEKVIQEIGVFHAALQCEKQEIVEKIDVLNASLQQLEYRSGTYMKLQPRDVSDREIRDFNALLRDCLSERFDGNASADELRFARIEKLIRRLREEERWRDKVTDVRRWFDFAARELDIVSGEERSCYEDSAGQSGGEKAKLAFTILVAAIAYQFDIDPSLDDDDRFHFVVVDEMFSKVDDRYAEYALQLFEKFGLQLLIVAPLDAKARVTEPYVGCYLHTVKDEKRRTSEVISMTAEDYAEAVDGGHRTSDTAPSLAAIKPK